MARPKVTRLSDVVEHPSLVNGLDDASAENVEQEPAPTGQPETAQAPPTRTVEPAAGAELEAEETAPQPEPAAPAATARQQPLITLSTQTTPDMVQMLALAVAMNPGIKKRALINALLHWYDNATPAQKDKIHKQAKRWERERLPD